MAEPATAAAPPSVAEGYRPLSLLAIVGLGLAFVSILLYLLWVDWLVLLPLAGVVVSAIALYRIKASDYALAGANVARAGLALSLVVGLSWVTMQTTSKLILQAEATRFGNKWFECLRDGKEALAFIATQRPGSRPPELTPGDLEPQHLRLKYPSPAGPELDQFRSSMLPELLLRGGKNITWQHLGIDDVIYEQGSYYVKHRYRIDTPELTGEMSLRMVSEQVDRPTGPRREWRIDMSSANLVAGSAQAKAYGQELGKARQEVFRVLTHWINMIGYAKKDEATRSIAGDKALLAEFERLYPALRQGGASALMPVELKGRQPSVLQAQCDGKRWTLTLRSTIEAGQRDVDFQTTWQNEEPNGDLGRWRLIDLKYLGDRKRMGPDSMRMEVK